MLTPGHSFSDELVAAVGFYLLQSLAFLASRFLDTAANLFFQIPLAVALIFIVSPKRSAVHPFAYNNEADRDLFELVLQAGVVVLPARLDFGRRLVPVKLQFHL